MLAWEWKLLGGHPLKNYTNFAVDMTVGPGNDEGEGGEEEHEEEEQLEHTSNVKQERQSERNSSNPYL